jgi:hypothetical protein
MTPRDRDHRARRIDARTGHQAFVDGALETERRPAQIPHGRESAHQRGVGLHAGQQVRIAQVALDRLRRRRPRQHRVPVVVDQSWHQRAPFAIDDREGRFRRDRRRGDPLDDIAPDQYVGRVGKLATLAVEHPHIQKQDRWCWRFRRGQDRQA